MGKPSIKDIRKEWSVPCNGEYRFEVDATEAVGISVLSGTAEILGAELVVTGGSASKEYEIAGPCKSFVFSHAGARLMVRGRCAVEYVSDESVAPIYLNTHLAIEGLRRDAINRQTEPPRIIVTGSSRNTVAQILTNYAIRAGRRPIFVDLDVANGSLLFPGVMAAQFLERMVDAEEGFSADAIPCCYFYGSLSPNDNIKIYRRLMARLAFAVNGRLARESLPDKSGAIIVTPAECEELLVEMRDSFQANLVIVVGNDRLHSTLSQTLSNCTVLKLPKSGGVVSKDGAFRRSLQHYRLQRYFYGPRGEYSPFSIVVGFDEVSVRRLGEDALAPKSALPLGAARKIDESRALKVEPATATMLYAVLSVSWAVTDDQLIDSNCAGFVYVSGVDETKKQLHLLSICPGKLPSNYLLLGSIKWIEK